MTAGVGVVGCGWVAEHRHAPALSQLGARVVACFDEDADTLARFATGHGARAFASADEVAAHPDVEVVLVASPPAAHAGPAAAALAARKHLMLEKPITLSLDEADDLVERAASAGVKAAVGFNMRWHRLYRRAAEMTRGGAVGEVQSVQSVFHRGAALASARAAGWHTERAQGGGALADSCVHLFDLWRFVSGDEVADVAAVCRHDGGMEDATVLASARLAGGALASAFASRRTGGENRLEVWGTAGVLRVWAYRADGLELVPAGRLSGDPAMRLRRAATALRSARRLLGRGDYVESYARQWAHLLDCIRRDLPVEATLVEGREAVRILTAAARSAEIGERVPVADAPRSVTPVGDRGVPL